MTQRIYDYDGTFQGFLTVMALLSENRDVPGKIISLRYQETGLFDDALEVYSDKEAAIRFMRKLKRLIGEEGFDNIFCAFLSGRNGTEMKIYDYANLGMSIGHEILGFHSDSRVREVHKLAQKVRHEVHKLTGFIRFREVEQGAGKCLYAPITPEYHVLPLLAPIFLRRMPDDNWVIHDTVRDVAVLGKDGATLIRKISDYQEPANSSDEAKYREMWHHYFKNMGIKERLNSKLQRQLVSLKYRKNMTEFMP